MVIITVLAYAFAIIYNNKKIPPTEVKDILTKTKKKKLDFTKVRGKTVL